MKKVLRMIGLAALASADIQSDSLALHNNERNNYGVPSVTWSADLAASAQAYAETMASTGTTSHSTNRVNVGENLAWGSGSSISVTSLGDLWIAEKQYFIPGTDFPDCSTTGSWHDVAHYTQLMWELTTEIGCGIAQASSGRYNYVCHYSPQGNIDGEPVYTAGSSSSSPSTSASSSSSAPSASASSSSSSPSVSTSSPSSSSSPSPTSSPSYENTIPNNEEGTFNTDPTTSTDNNSQWPNDNQNNQNNQWPNSNNQDNQNNQWPNNNNNNQNNQWPNNNNQGNQNNQWPSTRTHTRASSIPAATTSSSGSSSTGSQPSSSSSSPYTYSTSAPDASSSSFESDSLNAHNVARNAYGVPSLTWSTSLAQTAQSYSQVMASTGTTSHSTGRVDVGENLAWQSGSGTTTLALVNRWLNEKQYYIAGQDFPNVSTTGNWESVAHYTQMMWRQTTEVGCGVSEGSNGMYYYVCHYYVQGNIMGQPVY